MAAFTKSIFPLLVGFFIWVALPGFAQATISTEVLYPRRTDWSESTGQVNISSYVYRDLNDNGIYDLGDRALSHIVAAVGFEGVGLTTVRTNSNGFANFTSSAVKEGTVLSKPGLYELAIIPPPGWRVTSDNAIQTRELIVVPGSDGGFGLANMPVPVGLAQYTFVRGAYDGTLPTQARVLKDGVIVAEESVNPDGQFILPVPTGDYVLEIGGLRQDIHIEQFPVDIGLFDETYVTNKLEREYGFDDLAPKGLQKVPNGYAGLKWFNFNALSSSFAARSVGYQNGATSGEIVLYTSSGHPAELYSDIPFDFLSVNLSIAWPEAEGEEAVIEYYRGDQLVLTDVIALSVYGPISYEPMMRDITHVKIRSKHYWQIVLDDMVVALSG